MAILRAGPWGNLTDSFQAVPSDITADELTLYPVNCAKTNWISGQAWGAYYEVVESSCPETVTVDAHVFGGIITMDEVGESCTYYWSSPSGPYYGEADLSWNGSFWVYTESFSYGVYYSASGGSDINDPTGTYTSDDGNRTMT